MGGGVGGALRATRICARVFSQQTIDSTLWMHTVGLVWLISRGMEGVGVGEREERRGEEEREGKTL